MLLQIINLTMDLQISVPKTSTVDGSYTVYHILIKLPLRKYVLTKRYSDFVSLVGRMESETPQKFPYPLPQKTGLFQKSSNPAIVEERREKFEQILHKIVNDEDGPWRSTKAFLDFLELPQGLFKEKTSYEEPYTPNLGASNSSDPIIDAGVWLDTIGECRKLLRGARNSPQSRRNLVFVRSRFDPLSKGLDHLEAKGVLGTGELRRRKDILNSIKQEHARIEAEVSGEKTIPGSFVNAESDSLFRRSKRVLGGPIEETDQTRALNDTELFQQQKSKLKEQDNELDYLTEMIRKQRMIGVTINEELDYQNALLDELDRAVDKTGAKVKYASRKTNQING